MARDGFQVLDMPMIITLVGHSRERERESSDMIGLYNIIVYIGVILLFITKPNN